MMARFLRGGDMDIMFILFFCNKHNGETQTASRKETTAFIANTIWLFAISALTPC